MPPRVRPAALGKEEKGRGRYVEVALPLPVRKTFTYRVDGAPPPPPGTRVRVPFRRGERIGWVVGGGSPEGLSRIRPILDVPEREPSLPPDLLELARWMSEYYLTPLGITLRSMVPATLMDESRDYVTWREDAPPVAPGSLPPRAARVLAELRREGGTRQSRTLRRGLRLRSIAAELRLLEERGLVQRETRPPREPSVRTRKVVRLARWLGSLAERDELFSRAPRQRDLYRLLEETGGSEELAALVERGSFSRSVVGGLEEKGLVEVRDEEFLRDPFAEEEVPRAEPISPNPRQAAALDELRKAVEAGDSRPFLLHGVTGSGKTLVYIDLLREVVERRGRTAVVLVPEISLTPQTVRRFRAAFGDRVTVLHSALSDGERYDAWRELRGGRRRIVVGARSAVFAPLPDLGALVVDEEHDSSYKQSEAPRYQARDVAVMRARLAGAVCVLGSATPSLESWSNASHGKFRRLSLPERATGRPLPPVRVVDLREARRKEKGGGTPILTSDLVGAVRSRMERGEQSILLLNRRGYASFVQCMECGEVVDCPRCSVSLTFHRRRARMACHHCRHEEPAPRRCPGCGSTDLSFRGVGTEQVERAVTESFPGARVARMDVDTTAGKWAHHRILGRVGRGEVDILLGTQMIAKGLDFPGVTFVGVVNADVGLHLPDFRASERTFQLLSQVAGRTGRGDAGGDVLIQTAVPEHYAVDCALRHDYEGFAARELDERRAPPYPPHLRMANVVVSSPDSGAAAREADRAAAWVTERLAGRRADETAARGGERPAAPQPDPAAARAPGSGVGGIELVGPAPSPIERLHDRWRWHFLLRAASASRLGELLANFDEGFAPAGGEDVRVVIDRDPVALL